MTDNGLILSQLQKIMQYVKLKIRQISGILITYTYILLTKKDGGWMWISDLCSVSDQIELNRLLG